MATNWKALGLEKESIEMFSELCKTDLEKLNSSCFFEYPSVQPRKKDAEYCFVQITSCQHSSWWYEKLIGFEFFCRINFIETLNGRQIKEYTCVRLLKNKEIVFYTIDVKDAMII